VTFPDWEDSSIGRTIAFVSESKSPLTTLSQQNYFVRMAEDGYFRISDIQALLMIRNTKNLFITEKEDWKKNLHLLKKRIEAFASKGCTGRCRLCT